MKAVVKYNPETDVFDIIDEHGRWWDSKTTRWAAEEFARWLEKQWAEQD